MNTFFKTLPTTVNLNPEQSLQIVRAELTSDMSIAIDVVNIGPLPVTGINFTLIYKDENSNYLFNKNEFNYQVKDLNILPNQLFYITPISIDERFKDARAIEIRIREAIFSDVKNHVYSRKGEKSYTLPVITEDKLTKMKIVFGNEIAGYGENYIDSWRCVCGTFNKKEESECRNCKRNKSFVLNNLTEPLMNIKLLDTLVENGEVVDRNVLAKNLTQTHMSRVAPTTNVLETTRINPVNDEDFKNKFYNKKFISKFIPLAGIALLILIAGVFVYKISDNLLSTKRYKQAQELIAEGNYEQALKKLQKVSTKHYEVDPIIEKAKKLIDSEHAYTTGIKLLENSQYIDAIESFKTVVVEDSVHYEKSQEKIAEIETKILEMANQYVTEGKNTDAINLLTNYLKVVPESVNAEKLQSQLESNKSVEVPKNTSQDIDGMRARMAKKAEILIHTYQKVTTEDSNLRDNPSLNANIITTLSVDSDIYIKETMIEGTDRIWCKVQAVDAKTKANYEGWISNKLIK